MKMVKHWLGKAFGTAVILVVIAFAVYSVYSTLRAHYYGSRELVTSKSSPELFHQDTKALELYGKGSNELESGKLTAAEATFRRAIKTGGGNVNITRLNLYGLAQVLEKQGRMQEAYVVYCNAFPRMTSTSILDSDALALARYARVCDETGHWKEAVQLYGRAVGLLPLNSGDPTLKIRFSPSIPQQVRLVTILNIMIGISLGDHSEDNEALILLKDTVRKHPDCPLAQYYFGRALVKARRPVEAKAAFERANQLGNSDVKAAAQRAQMANESVPQ